MTEEAIWHFLEGLNSFDLAGFLLWRGEFFGSLREESHRFPCGGLIYCSIQPLLGMLEPTDRLSSELKPLSFDLESLLSWPWLQPAVWSLPGWRSRATTP